MTETQTDEHNPLVDGEPDGDETPDEATESPEAEPDGDDDDEQGAEANGDEQAAQPPTAPAETPEALEKRARSAEKRFATYAKGIEGLYEDTDARLLPCPLCPDQHKGFVDLNFAGMIPEDIQANVNAYLGLARERTYKPSRRYHTCPECDGEGKVETGSHVATQKTITCDDCKGRGYVPPPGPTPENGITGPTQYTPEQLEQYSQAREDFDEWNEPRILPDGRENPNFGRMPNRKVLVEPWGVTAGLNALDAVG